MFKVKFQKLFLVFILGIVTFSLTPDCKSIMQGEGLNSLLAVNNTDVSMQKQVSDLKNTIKELNEFCIGINKLEKKYIEINYFSKTKI